MSVSIHDLVINLFYFTIEKQHAPESNVFLILSLFLHEINLIQLIFTYYFENCT